MRVIALVDGEHHPGVVRAALDLAGAGARDRRGAVRRRRGEGPRRGDRPIRAAHYGRDGHDARPRPAGRAARARPRRAARAQWSISPASRCSTPTRASRWRPSPSTPGWSTARPAWCSTRPRRSPPQTGGIPVVAVIGTGKRTGKTALGTHLAALLRDAGERPGRRVDGARRAAGAGRRARRGASRPGRSCSRSRASGGHAASDYLEDAVLAGVTTVGCRRCGEGPAGETFVSTVVEGLRVARRGGARRDRARRQRCGAAAGRRARDAVRHRRGACARAGALVPGPRAPAARRTCSWCWAPGSWSRTQRRRLEDDLARWIPRGTGLVACELWPEPAEPLRRATRASPAS